MSKAPHAMGAELAAEGFSAEAVSTIVDAFDGDVGERDPADLSKDEVAETVVFMANMVKARKRKKSHGDFQASYQHAIDAGVPEKTAVMLGLTLDSATDVKQVVGYGLDPQVMQILMAAEPWKKSQEQIKQLFADADVIRSICVMKHVAASLPPEQRDPVTFARDKTPRAAFHALMCDRLSAQQDATHIDTAPKADSRLAAANRELEALADAVYAQMNARPAR